MVAIAIAVFGPAIFAAVGYFDDAALHRFQGELTARQVARYAYVQGSTWRFSEHRIAELVRRIAPADDPGRQIISAIDGGEPIVIGDMPVAPVMRVSVPIVVGVEPIGTVSVEASLRPLLWKVGLAAIVGIVLAAIAYGCVRFPLIRLRRAVEAQEYSEARFRALAEAAPMAITLRNPDDHVRWANDEALRRVGLTIEEWREKGIHDIFVDEIADKMARLDAMVLETGRPQIVELDIETRNGETWPELHVRFPIKDEKGAVVGLGMAGLDISDRRLAEERLRQTQRLQAVGQLTGGVAHDFNNLLQVVEVSLGMVREDLSHDSEAVEFIDAAMKAGRRGAALIHKLLVFSRQQTLWPTRFDVNAWAAERVSLLTDLMGEGIAVSVHPCNGKADVVADAGCLSDVLANVAQNARAAMPEGGIFSVSVHRRRFGADRPVEGRDLPPGDYVEIAMRDTGCGMPEEVRDHAFEPFFTTRDVGEGSGLGLSMVYGFAMQSSGGVLMESEVGMGTTVRLLLPAAEPEDAATDGTAKRKVLEPS